MDDNQDLNPSEEEAPEMQTSEVPAEAIPGTLEEESTSGAHGWSKKWMIISGLAVIFLAAAVFFGARLLKPQTNMNSGGDFGPSLGLQSGKAGGGQKSVRLNMTPAKELPQDKASANGLFVRREDQSIFIGTGNVQIAVRKSSSGSSPDVSSKYDGPVVEVVINHQTKIYQDITDITPPDSSSGGEVTMQQVVKLGSLDDLSANSMVTVWGDKQGDRFIARVIAFR